MSTIDQLALTNGITQLTQFGTVSLVTLLFSLVAATLVGGAISLVYRFTNDGFSYESTFNLTLVMLTVIVCVIMITIGSNLVLSLGLIGSLSIIRFRTPIKSSVDMAYLFWAIAEGLSIGAGQYEVALVTLLFLSLVMALNRRFPFLTSNGNDHVLLVRMENDEVTAMVVGALNQTRGLRWRMKSSHCDKAGGLAEATFDLGSRHADLIPWVVNTVSRLNGVRQVSLLSPETHLFV